MLDGILIIDKPAGITSHDVVAKVRKALKTKKVGHTGTLDPLATGVLVACVEKATKLVNYLTCDEKTYEVEMKFGIKTDTGDITGKIIDEDPNYDIDINKIKNIINKFIGKQKQIPPMYSAIKINGKKLYELAREGIEIEREAREIEIFDIRNIEWKNEILKYTVHCSKGTYIRSLCEDIAKELGTIGTMTNLRRIQSGEFQIKDAIKIEDISEEKIISMEKLFDKEINVKNNLKELLNGMKIQCIKPDGLYKLYTDEFIGIGKIEKNYLKREIIL
jgi:tRNA pseudouridine55 synthase